MFVCRVAVARVGVPLSRKCGDLTDKDEGDERPGMCAAQQQRLRIVGKKAAEPKPIPTEAKAKG